MKTNRMLRTLCAMLALVIALSVPTMGLAEEIAVTAKAAKPTGVELTITEKTILPGQKLQLSATVAPEDASQSVTWKSSKTSVATVSSKGVVTGKAAGTAKITATTKKGGKKATCTIKVSKQFEGVNVHFYGIGNSNYSYTDKLPGCATDVEAVASLYASATFGSKWVGGYVYKDLTGAEMRTMFTTMINDVTIAEDDITVFYYSGHGANDGSLCGIDASDYSATGFLSVNEVQRYLDQVKGTVVVILDSCYSGAFIKSKGGEAETVDTATLNRANNAWITALATSKATNFNAKALPDSSNKYKYRILTSASNSQISWGGDAGYLSLFTYYFYQGIYGRKADTNNDKVFTLQEVYKRTYSQVEKAKKQANKTRSASKKIKQVTKVWPSGNNFPIYARN